jgi:phosphomevalonate kinase
MSKLAGVPVEPEAQTRLLDACGQLPGVVIGGVPGAGGFDAIFLLVIDRATTSTEHGQNGKKVEDLWRAWKEMDVGPLLARQSASGLRLEDYKTVPGLSEVLSA